MPLPPPSPCLSSYHATWWLFASFLGVDALLIDSLLLLMISFVALAAAALLAWFTSPGGPAWSAGRNRRGNVAIPGSPGLPVFGSIFALTHGKLPHRELAAMASAADCSGAAKRLMAFSIGTTAAVVSSSPETAREILTHPLFSDRPLKRSARELLFSRAIGFAPAGAYWRILRRIASAHLFSPRRLAAHEPARRAECEAMLAAIAGEQATNGVVRLRPHIQAAALNTIIGSVFGCRYGAGDPAAEELRLMIREGFDLLGAFNWSDHLPWLPSVFDPARVTARCAALVPRVQAFVRGVINDHRSSTGYSAGDEGDFVDVLLSLNGEEKLDDDDMVAVLWEMIFRGSDTTALLTEWAMAELVLHPQIQSKLRAEVDASVNGGGVVTDADVARMPYLQAVIKETLRVHPPGPLLSWARLSTADVQLSNGMVLPAGTTAMVNMWAIATDPDFWPDPAAFRPERFSPSDGGAYFDVRGGDLRLAPFGAGRRVCPGKNLAMANVGLWVAELVRQFEWRAKEGVAVELGETMKLSLQMKKPLVAVAVAREV